MSKIHAVKRSGRIIDIWKAIPHPGDYVLHDASKKEVRENLGIEEDLEEEESDEADLKAAPSPSRRSDPDLDITEIGDIALTTDSMEAEGV